MPESESDHPRAKKTGSDRGLFELGIIGHWKARNIKNADAFWIRHPNTFCYGYE